MRGFESRAQRSSHLTVIANYFYRATDKMHASAMHDTPIALYEHLLRVSRNIIKSTISCISFEYISRRIVRVEIGSLVPVTSFTPMLLASTNEGKRALFKGQNAVLVVDRTWQSIEVCPWADSSVQSKSTYSSSRDLVEMD